MMYWLQGAEFLAGKVRYGWCFIRGSTVISVN